MLYNWLLATGFLVRTGCPIRFAAYTRFFMPFLSLMRADKL